MCIRDSSNTVFLETWYTDLHPLDDAAERYTWDTVMQVRSAVSKCLETTRKVGTIGSALDAEVTLYCSDELHTTLAKLGDELRFVLITSSADIATSDLTPDDAITSDLAGLSLSIQASTAAKCPRCWHHCTDIGTDSTHPELCGRCVQNVAGTGEQRRFA